MKYKSFFMGNFNLDILPYLKIYPIETKCILDILKNEPLSLNNLYVEEGDSTIENPSDVITELDFNKNLTANELFSFLNSNINYFVLKADFELINKNVKFLIDDNIETTILSSNIKYITDFLEIVLVYFSLNIYKSLYELIIKYPDKIICLNEDGTLWKIFNDNREFLNDEEAMKYY